MKKEKALQIHVRRRGLSRYNLNLSKRKQKEIVSKIRHGNCKNSKKLTNTRSYHVVEYQGIDLPVIYDKKRKKLVTVLPKHN